MLTKLAYHSPDCNERLSQVWVAPINMFLTCMEWKRAKKGRSLSPPPSPPLSPSLLLLLLIILWFPCHRFFLLYHTVMLCYPALEPTKCDAKPLQRIMYNKHFLLQLWVSTFGCFVSTTIAPKTPSDNRKDVFKVSQELASSYSLTDTV